MKKEKLNELIHILGKEKVLAAYEIMGEEKISFARLMQIIRKQDIECSLFASKLSVASIAKRFQVSKMTIYRMIRSRKRKRLSAT